MEWFNSYAPTVIVGLCVLALIGMAVRKMARDKKSGCGCSGGCPGGCSGCPTAKGKK